MGSFDFVTFFFFVAAVIIFIQPCLASGQAMNNARH